MTKTGYPTAFAAALVGAAATIGPVIPPSIIMVIYASIANVSVGRLFLGGIIPGLLMGGWLMVLTALFARRMKLPRGPYVGLDGNGAGDSQGGACPGHAIYRGGGHCRGRFHADRIGGNCRRVRVAAGAGGLSHGPTVRPA